MQTIKPNDPNLVLSPLSDPVFGAIHADVDVAGLSMESFITATLESDNEKLMGSVKAVTPQQVHTSTSGRGCRVDVESDTNENERAITEVQINPDKRIMLRNLFTSSHVFYETSEKGDTSNQMADKMPRVIHINVLGYNIRKNSSGLVEPFKIMYTKEPREVAIPNFSGYNIQLPKIYEMKPDFNSSLYCWCYMLYTAHKEGKTVKEVVAMSTALQEFADRDAGFQQFCERYNHVTADPKTRREYVAWVNDRMRQAGELEWVKEEAYNSGVETGIKSGIESGIKSGIELVALNMLKRNRSLDQIVEDTGLSFEEILKLQESLK